MPDYKEMYLMMARAVERAERILIEAQQKCEEMYLETADDSPETTDWEEQKRIARKQEP